MKYLNLEQKKVEATVQELNLLLADYTIYYQKLRNFHWNIVGDNFFILHEKFEEMYEDAKTKIDEIAERILTLRYQPESNFSKYLKMSHLKESSSSLTDKQMVKELLKDHSALLKQMTVIIETAEASGDEGTIDLLTPYIAELEKTSWMLDAWTMSKTDTHKTI